MVAVKMMVLIRVVLVMMMVTMFGRSIMVMTSFLDGCSCHHFGVVVGMVVSKVL